MARAASGDRAAYDRLAERHLGRVYRIARQMAGDPADAEDIAQEAMLRAWRHADRFDPARGALSSWLNRLTVNAAIDRSRMRRASSGTRADLALGETVADPAPDALAHLESRERRDALADGLASLPDRQRRALVMTYLEDATGQDAASALGISVRALEGLLRRGRQFLKAWVQARESSL